MRNNIVIVIPCYNAKNSILQTIKDLLTRLPNAQIIIVDDSSPDGTADEIEKYFAKDKRIILIIRGEKGGRGSAVLRGFQEGLKDKDIKFFVEMDADLCHDAKYIPIKIKKCVTNDVVITAKYRKESRINGLSIGRKIFSKIVNFYIKFVLQVPITDYTNGFRCYKRTSLEKINLDSFHSKGFILLSEIIYKMHKKGVSIGEIPFVFNFRQMNKSNFNLTEVKEAFITILKLKFNSTRS